MAKATKAKTIERSIPLVAAWPKSRVAQMQADQKARAGVFEVGTKDVAKDEVKLRAASGVVPRPKALRS